MKKKAISLSINLITIFIISIAVFALGIFSVRHFVGTTEQLEEEISLSIENQISQLLSSTNEKVVLPEFRQEIRQGQTHSFALGIRNYLEETADFTVRMSFSTAEKQGQEVAVSTDMGKWIFESQGPFTLLADEQKIILLPVRAVDAEKGVTYIFDVEVTCSLNTYLCNPYGYRQKIYADII
jgi:hypothetical protein